MSWVRWLLLVMLIGVVEPEARAIAAPYVPPAAADVDQQVQTDVRNVKLIRSVEDEFGGALRDEDWLIEPATDGA